MTELGVSDTQFVEACQKAESNPIHKKIVDQIMAVDNFLAFKRLMVKRNQELNRQAMEMFQKQQNSASATTETPAKDTTALGAPPTETAAAADPTANMSEEEKKKQVDELKEVMRVAHSLERAEEEEMMKRAMEESQKISSEE